MVGLAALLSGDRGEARRYLSESLSYFKTGTLLQEMLLALLGVAFFLARQGEAMASARVYIAIRHYPQIADSVFCQQVAGRELEALLARLTPEQAPLWRPLPVRPICASWPPRCGQSYGRQGKPSARPETSTGNAPPRPLHARVARIAVNSLGMVANTTWFVASSCNPSRPRVPVPRKPQ